METLILKHPVWGFGMRYAVLSQTSYVQTERPLLTLHKALRNQASVMCVEDMLKSLFLSFPYHLLAVALWTIYPNLTFVVHIPPDSC